MSNFTFKSFFIFIPILMDSIVGLSNPDTAFTQPLVVNPSPTSTIPALPEQSDTVSCPLHLSPDFFHGVEAACGVDSSRNEELRRSRCCPVLAAWLYSAYSATALDRAARVHPITSYDMPLLPDDSETCVDDLGKALSLRGLELVKPNETCELVSCYCGIRLHPVSCPQAFSVTPSGKLQGDEKVKRLERNCLSGGGGCSNCLHSLYRLNHEKTSNGVKPEDRSSKMHSRDCEVLGLTWLLAKNMTGYIETVTSVLRAIMVSSGDSDSQSCTLNSDGMPLAVDSRDMSDPSSLSCLQADTLLSWVLVSLVLLCFGLDIVWMA